MSRIIRNAVDRAIAERGEIGIQVTAFRHNHMRMPQKRQHHTTFEITNVIHGALELSR